MRTKLRRASDGAVIDRTFRAGEKFRSVRTEARRMQFLYADGTDAHFMDSSPIEQIAVPESSVSERAALDEALAARWTSSSSTSGPPTCSCRAPWTSRSPRPNRACAATPPPAAGTKPATLETGATIQVPLFINVGERVRVDTRSGEYVSRA